MLYTIVKNYELEGSRIQSYKYYYDEGMEYYNVGWDYEAIKNFQYAIALNRNHIDSYIGKAESQFALRLYKESWETFYASTQIESTYEAYIGMGKCNLKLNNPQEAIGSYLKAIEIKPDLPSTYMMISNIFKDLNQIYESSMYLHQYYEKQYLITRNSFERGQIFRKQEKFREAIFELDKYITENPNSFLGLNEKGIVLINLSDYEEALKYFNMAKVIKPLHADTYYNKSELYRILNNYDYALGNIDKAIELNNNNYDYYILKGKIQKEMKEYKKSISTFLQAVNIQNGSSEPLYYLGLNYYFLKDKENSNKYLSQAIKCNTKTISDVMGIANSYLLLNDYDAARPYYRNAIRMKSYNPELLNNYGYLQIQRQNYKKAIKYLEIATNQRKHFPSGYYNLAEAYRLAGNNIEALRALDKYLEFDITHDKAKIYNRRGLIFIGLKYYKLALIEFNKAINLDYDYKEAYYNKALVYSIQNQYDDAIINFDIALKIDPNYTEPMIAKCKLFEELKRYNSAINEYLKLISINPKEESYYFNKGKIYILLKQYENAIIEFNKAIDLNPDYVDAMVEKANAQVYMNKQYESIITYDEIEKIDNTNYYVNYNKGKTLYNMGNYNAANSEFIKAVVNYPMGISV